MQTKENFILRDKAKILNIAIPQGFQLIFDKNPQTILLSRDRHGNVFQLTSDGEMMEKENVLGRIKLIIDNTKEFMKSQNLEVDDKTYIFHKKVKTKNFTFYLYAQDMIMPTVHKIVRNFIAFFVEKKMKCFYQITWSVGPFTMPTEILKPKVIDVENDSITKAFFEELESLVGDISYNEEELKSKK